MPTVAPPSERRAPRKRYAPPALTLLRPVAAATAQRTHRWDRPVAVACASADACVPLLDSERALD